MRPYDIPAREGEAHAGKREPQRPWIVPIPGTTKLHRLEENLGAVNVELTPDDLREIDAAASAIPVRGDRYSEGSQKMIDR